MRRLSREARVLILFGVTFGVGIPLRHLMPDDPPLRDGTGQPVYIDSGSVVTITPNGRRGFPLPAIARGELADRQV